ncbi:phytoene/squalene synthase family protein [Microbacterium hydrocarbonoxydans]|uniref:phytoene/squalene synthase family protein n=1 Tax=Microbacterium hydrocarbonoxydans TaxID=273678 RepID=UPI0007BC182C|nr:squalene/phytoene synthase family protein [Microbacterium hydrocarbonoxydans]GAT73988.1 phytoene synthase CrtB [Microbacterium sp. HM58-2]
MTGTAPAIADDALARFTRTAEAASADVIRAYSTSFGLATRLLGARHRQHVRNIYAMVRVADEIVDGVAAAAGLDPQAQSEALAGYVDDTHRAMSQGYSSNIVLHAFARTAREAGIDETLTQPFFDSMAADLDGAEEPRHLKSYDAEQHRRYVFGSAEVVGLMCLRVFLRAERPGPADLASMEHGARQLGAAFQNVNFLRDLTDDTERLHRDYLGGAGRLTDSGRDAWVETVRGQLADARRTIPLLPRDCRAAVRTAHDLFEALTRRVERTPAEALCRERVRVPDTLKAALALRAVLATAGRPS